MDSSEIKTRGAPITGGLPQYFEIYLQELKEILAVNLPGKSSPAFGVVRRKETTLNTPEHAVLPNKVCPQVKLVNQSLS